jgi:hypothetical protein
MDVTSRVRHSFDSVWFMYDLLSTKHRSISNNRSMMAPISASRADHEPHRGCAVAAPECLQGKGFWRA